jgi:hypothetical protein
MFFKKRLFSIHFHECFVSNTFYFVEYVKARNVKSVLKKLGKIKRCDDSPDLIKLIKKHFEVLNETAKKDNVGRASDDWTLLVLDYVEDEQKKYEINRKLN